MKTVELSKANGTLAEHARRVNREPVVVTRNGKPIAALVSLKGEDTESIALALNPKFMKIIEESRASLKKHGGIPSRELRRQFGLT